jgi:hypothetical protein
MQDSTNPQGSADAQPGVSESDYEEIGALFIGDGEEEETAVSTSESTDNETSEEAEAVEETAEAEQSSDNETEEQEEIEPTELAPDLLIKLSDGTTTTAKELFDGNLRTADYTRKTQEVAENRRALEAKQAEIAELETKAAEERDLMVDLMRQYLPEEPPLEMMQSDPIGYMQAKEYREQQAGVIKQLVQQRDEARQQQQAEIDRQQAEYLGKQRELMLEFMPELKDPAKMHEFTSDATNVFAKEYGFTAEELSATVDARYMRVIRDAIAYQKLQKEAPKVAAEVQDKPKMLKNSPRKSRNNKASRDVLARIDSASKTGRTETISDILGELIG